MKAMTVTGFLRVIRAPFLLLPLTLVAVGAAAAYREGRFSWQATGLAALGLVALHVAVNVFNELSDFATGIDLATRRTPFSGGSGALPEAAVSPAQARLVAWAAFGLGAAVGVYFLLQLGWRLLPVLLLGAVATLFYTPHLARLGLGELFAGLGLGFLPVLGTSLVQGGAPGSTSFWAAIPAFFMTFDLLLLNEFPDEQADRGGGRRHLVILLGRRAAAWVYAAAALAAPLSVAAGILLGALPIASWIALLPSLLLFKPLAWAASQPEQDPPLPALASNVQWNLLTNALLAASLLL
jgi:1,4-dihydroxy-2-naphthoate octaprenyltransferase